MVTLKDRRPSASADPTAIRGLLTEDDKAFYARNGYLVVPKAISRELATELGEAMRAYVKATADARGGAGPGRLNGVVHMYHHPVQWAVRQSPGIYEAFAHLWGDRHLWVSIDRGKVTPPVGDGGPLQRGFIHWDINSLAPPDPIPLQGLIALADTRPGQGGFQCVPGFPARFAQWAATQPPDRHPYLPDLTGLEVVSVPMEAGDLLIWNALLPHGNEENRSHAPRLVQFIRMYPCRLYDEAVREKRLAMWREKLPRDPGLTSALDWPDPMLSELGERLLGLRSWT